MDNLTHSLVGALVGATAARCIPAVNSTLPASTRHSLFLSLLVVGGNLPDLDLLYTGVLDGNLGYLLHHRGHTHTLIGAVVGAVILFAVSLLWLRWRHLPSSKADRYWLALLALLAPLLHLGMDAANSYGVHPFWPFNNDWLYGDAIFIVEPLFWACAAPLVFLLQSRWARGVIGVILCSGIALSFGMNMVPRPMAVGLTVLTLAMLFVGWRTSGRTAALTGLVAAVTVLSTFLLASQQAQQKLTALVTAQYPAAQLLDHVMTPMPVNPLCWNVILVQLEQDRYSVRRALFSLAPHWLPAERCPPINVNAATTATYTPVMGSDSASLHWHGEMTMSLAELQQRTAGNCEAAAFTRFARALFILPQGDQWLLGDVRFDTERGLGFAEVAFSANPTNCPHNVPPWTPPRSDVLDLVAR
jgi:inner membrane protein